ncbi:hypothetical protein Btru_062265 [Bulinus truncatus]|nr:hypothetical protein Btru_062265 [Bulinus truncatus]
MFPCNDINCFIHYSVDPTGWWMSEKMDGITLLWDGRPPHATLVEQTLCKGKEHLQQEFNRVLHNGGEELLLRHPKSNTVLKLEKLYSAEAVVIAHKEKNTILCQMEKGVQFSLSHGLTDLERLNLPKIGSVVKFHFSKLSKSGIPLNPFFKGVCADKTYASGEIKDVTFAPKHRE